MERDKKENKIGRVIGLTGFILLVVCVVTFTVMYIVNSYSFSQLTLKRLITEQVYYDQAIFPQTQEEDDLLYDHLFRITKISPYRKEMSVHDQFMLIQPVESWELSKLKSFATNYLSDMEALEDVCEFSLYFNRIFSCNNYPEKMGITNLEQIVDIEDYFLITSPVTGETFLPARPVPTDTATLWKRINYKNYTNLQLLSEGRQVANLSFPKDSLSADIAPFEILRPALNFSAVKPRNKKDKYAIATKVILIKDVSMAINHAEPRIRYQEADGSYVISNPTIMEPVYNPGVTYVAYICTIFYDGN